MMKKIMFVLLVAGSLQAVAGVARAGDFNGLKTFHNAYQMRSTLLFLSAIDLAQSSNFSGGMYEMNPLLGRHPSTQSMAVFALAANVLISYVADHIALKWREVLWDTVLTSEKMNIEGNAQLLTFHRREIPMALMVTLRMK